jgi:hypothetical protein
MVARSLSGGDDATKLRRKMHLRTLTQELYSKGCGHLNLLLCYDFFGLHLSFSPFGIAMLDI